ncbi:unnamed protein product [Urochloa humidicola]
MDDDYDFPAAGGYDPMAAMGMGMGGLGLGGAMGMGGYGLGGAMGMGATASADPWGWGWEWGTTASAGKTTRRRALEPRRGTTGIQIELTQSVGTQIAELLHQLVNAEPLASTCLDDSISR